jgi:DegV family protein with EDD domain
MRIVMDDAGDIPAEAVEKYNIKVVPINITFGTEEYLTGVSLDHQEFYDKVKEVGAHNFPKSSQPTPYQFAEVFSEIMAEDEDEILTITVGEKLSGTYVSAEAAGKELEYEGACYLFDSAGGSASQGYMVIEAARMAQSGASIDEIMSRLNEMRDSQVVVFLVDSLEYAVKGGRVGSLQSSMSSLLRIKPIMEIKDGLIVEAGKVRTYGKALNYIVDYVAEQVGDRSIKLAVIHAGSPEGAAKLQDMARERLNIAEEFVADMGISVAINLGPGALGIVAIPE